MSEESEIPQRATQRHEYVKCGNAECKCFEGQKIHGPYIYAYWKEKGKLKKKYIGKSWDDSITKKVLKDNRMIDVDFTFSKFRKFEFIEKQANQGNKLAMEYIPKLRDGKVTIGCVHKVLTDRIKDVRTYRLIGLAKKDYDDIRELMKSNNLTTEDELDGYLNSKFM